MPVLKDKTIVAADPQFLEHIPADPFRIIKHVKANNNELADLFIAVAASALPEYAAEIQKVLNDEHFRILFLREDIDIDWLPAQLLKANFSINKLLPKLLLYSDWRVPQRVINAWADDSQHVLIANAFVTRDALIIGNCALEKIELSFEHTPVLCDIPVQQRAKFEIDNAGSFISWPDLDIDLDFDELRYFADPELRKKCDAERVLTEQGFGYAIAGVRKYHNITQAKIESSTGISERQLRRYETDGIKPRVSSLEKLAQAHGLDLNAYLEKLARVISGPIAIIIPCETIAQQSEIPKWLKSNFSLLKTEQGRPLQVYRPKGSKDYDIWTYNQQHEADEDKEQLALAVRVDSVEDFEAVWSLCTKKGLAPNTTVGLDRWPSIGFIPATLEYVVDKIRQRTSQQRV